MSSSEHQLHTYHIVRIISTHQIQVSIEVPGCQATPCILQVPHTNISTSTGTYNPDHTVCHICSCMLQY